MKPRNTLVLLDLLPTDAEKKHGSIIVSENTNLYSEAIVIAVGPGAISASGGISETSDLKPGQRVLVKAKEQRGDPRTVAPSLAGIRYQQDDRWYYIFEQMSVVGIVAEPTLN